MTTPTPNKRIALLETRIKKLREHNERLSADRRHAETKNEMYKKFVERLAGVLCPENPEHLVGMYSQREELPNEQRVLNAISALKHSLILEEGRNETLHKQNKTLLHFVGVAVGDPIIKARANAYEEKIRKMPTADLESLDRLRRDSSAPYLP